MVGLFFDTNPFNGGINTSDELRIVLSTVKFKGNSFSSIITLSILHSADLNETITDAE